MKSNIALSLLAGTLFLSGAVDLHGAEKAKPHRCLIGVTLGEGVFVAGSYDPKAGWQRDEKSKAWFASGTNFTVFNQQTRLGELILKKVEVADGVGGYYADTTAKLPERKVDKNVRTASANSLLALSGAERPMPRVPREQSLTTALYRRSAAGLLRKGGLKLDQAKLTQHWRVDLNGDGVEEVLMTAHSRKEMGHEPSAKRGDYALAAIRYVVKGKVRTETLALDAYTRDHNEGALAAARFELMGCYDIDGDGRMEIALSTGYYEGFGLAVFKFDGKSVRPVLEAGWGA